MFDIHLRGQALVLHVLVCVSFVDSIPSCVLHISPPFIGGGLVHDLLLLCVPPLQGTVQTVYLDHIDHPPCAINKIHSLMFKRFECLL